MREVIFTELRSFMKINKVHKARVHFSGYWWELLCSESIAPRMGDTNWHKVTCKRCLKLKGGWKDVEYYSSLFDWGNPIKRNI